jgi:mono/diheme cytochrome c family protein
MKDGPCSPLVEDRPAAAGAISDSPQRRAFLPRRWPVACVRCAPVLRPKLTFVLALFALAALAACGKSIVVPKSDKVLHEGAVLFNMRCSGCHTLDAAATSGSKSKREIKGGERTDGPNFNVRKERNMQDVLFAIRNGGCSGAIMPANIVVGQQAQAVAQFLVKYSGAQSGSSSGSP